MDAVPGRTAYQRLPGLTFLPRQPSRRQPLPRLDVAAFVGFAARGPLHVPVPLEDFSTYQAVFGGDLDLAQEAGERVVKANLPRAVHQFFANGGQRCYVVRVAGCQAEAARLRLPGMVALNSRSGPRLAALSASSPGAWGAGLRLAARLAVSPLPGNGTGGPAEWAIANTGAPALQFVVEALRRSGVPAIQAGDVLRLRFDDRERWLALVAAVERRPRSGSTPELLLAHLGAIYRLLPSLSASPPEEVTRLELLTTEGASELQSVGLLVAADGGVALELDPADAPRLSAGDVLRLHLSSRPPGDLGYIVRIKEIQAQPSSAGGSPPLPIFAAVLAEALQLSPQDLPASPPVGFTRAELLRLDLLLRLRDERLPAIAALAFNPGHPRFWGDVLLLESSPLLQKRTTGSRYAASGYSTTGSNPCADSAAWHRRLMRDPYDLMPLPGLSSGQSDAARRATSQNFNGVAALAGLLAPAGSHLGLSWQAAFTAGATGGSEAYADADEELALAFLPVGMPEIVDDADPSQLRPPEEGRAGHDDLSTFDAGVFYDRYLAPPGAAGGAGPGESHRTLLPTAFDLHYVQGRDLRGLHSLLFLDDVAMIAAPDACHDPWQLGEPEPAPIPPRPLMPSAETPCPPVADFADCKRPPVLSDIEPYYGPFDAETPVTVRGESFGSSLSTRLMFGARPAEGLQVLSSQELIATAPPGVRPGPVDVSVHTHDGSSSLAGGFIYTHASTAPPLPVVDPYDPNDLVENQPYLAVHQALAIFCQARADAICLLSLPHSYDVSRCIEWQQALRRRLGLPDLGEGFAFDEPEEIADLSFAAVYHPWLLVADAQAADRVRPVPPDGAIAGLIAGRERERQAWVAPANLPLREVLGLLPAVSDDDWAELFAWRFILVRPEANGFCPMSAHTLSGEQALLQVSVRRLLILLRKAALQLGMDFVFQPNHELFRQGIRVVVEDFLRFLFERGAFAGRSEAESFRVVVDASVNPPQSVEQGRLVVVIQVAPSQPMEFITVQLVRSGEGELQIE
jgi:hypothetical protein